MFPKFKYLFAVFLLFCFLTAAKYDPAWGNLVIPQNGVGNIFGIIGALFTSLFLDFAGICAYLIPLNLIFFEHRNTQRIYSQILFHVIFTASLSVFIAAFFTAGNTQYFFIYGSIGASAQILFSSISARMFLIGIIGLNLFFLAKTLRFNKGNAQVLYTLFKTVTNTIWFVLKKSFSLFKFIKINNLKFKKNRFKTPWTGHRKNAPLYSGTGTSASVSGEEEGRTSDIDELDGMFKQIYEMGETEDEMQTSVNSKPDDFSGVSPQTDNNSKEDYLPSDEEMKMEQIDLTDINNPKEPKFIDPGIADSINSEDKTDYNASENQVYINKGNNTQEKESDEIQKNATQLTENDYDGTLSAEEKSNQSEKDSNISGNYSQIYGKNTKSKYIQTALEGLKPEELYQLDSTVNDSSLDILMNDLRETDEINKKNRE